MSFPTASDPKPGDPDFVGPVKPGEEHTATRPKPSNAADPNDPTYDKERWEDPQKAGQDDQKTPEEKSSKK